ncbi:MAG: bifunctional hydroxymethylpyrimidine kinase/phosphomethylpyrimidine kinase [Akkermansia sp.]|nr:bifunctional hydroxymethylpyrimidine kinase/phosphomethylpyrimidine kinase [Akkermansia sp.]
MSTTPVFLSIAGSDCSAGAGLQADLKTGFALGCYPLTAVTCVVNEVPGLVEGIVSMEPDFVADQVKLCLSIFPVKAVKTGMLYSPEIVRACCAALEGFSGPIVVDPVMIATAGEALMQQAAIQVYEEVLLPRTTLLTPNKDELETLLGATVNTVEELTEAAEELCRRYNCAILAKGGHVEGSTCTDVLAVKPGTAPLQWSHPRITGISTHGTGCTLSSAITAWLAQGYSLEQSVERGLDYISKAIAASHNLGGVHAVNHQYIDG